MKKNTETKSKNFEFSLLENAMDFIHEAIVNAKKLDKYSLKYSVLHLSAGFDLVIKYLLVKEHWTLIFSDLKYASKEKFISGDFKSVNSEVGLERLQQIAGYNFDDKEMKSIRKLREYRNKLEHYGMSANALAVEDCVVKILILIYDLIEDSKSEIYEHDEMAYTIYGHSIDELIGFDKFIEYRMKHLSNKLKDDYVYVLKCFRCDQKSVVVEHGKVTCLCCNDICTVEDYILQYIDYELESLAEFVYYKENQDYVLQCQVCNEKTLLKLSTSESSNYYCLTCNSMSESGKSTNDRAEG